MTITIKHSVVLVLKPLGFFCRRQTASQTHVKPNHSSGLEFDGESFTKFSLKKLQKYLLEIDGNGVFCSLFDLRPWDF